VFVIDQINRCSLLKNSVWQTCILSLWTGYLEQFATNTNCDFHTTFQRSLKTCLFKTALASNLTCTTLCCGSVSVCPSVCYRSVFCRSGWTWDHANCATQSLRDCSFMMLKIWKKILIGLSLWLRRFTAKICIHLPHWTVTTAVHW